MCSQPTTTHRRVLIATMIVPWWCAPVWADGPNASPPAPVRSETSPGSGRQVDLSPRPLGTPRTSAPADTPDAGADPGSASTAATSETRSTSVLPIGTVTRTAGALLVVLALLIGLALLAKRVMKSGSLPGFAGAPSPAGILEVLGRYPLSRGQSLVLLKLDRRILLVAHGTASVRGGSAPATTLCELTDPEEVASILLKAQDAEGRSAAERFNDLLSRFDREHHQADEWSPGVTHADASVVVVPPGAGLRLSRAESEGRSRSRAGRGGTA